MADEDLVSSEEVNREFVKPTNAWPEAREGDEPGVWESKNPFSYDVWDKFGQRFIVWRFPKAGGIIRPHTHSYDHCTMLQQGTVVVTGDSERPDGSIMTAPDTLFFAAGKEHSIKALTDGVILTHTYPQGFTPEDVL